MPTDCEICHRIERFTPENPYLVAELQTGYFVLADNQHIPGYTIFLAKRCVPELHDLPNAERTQFLEEMAVAAEATFRAFKPRKLNYELLGNSVSHLHWHLFPRYDDDPNPQWPVWNNEAFVAASREPARDRGALAERRARLRETLAAVRSSQEGT
jgi:diadenosine tetraphosphate (Ap4A) HIT family hydrolase